MLSAAAYSPFSPSLLPAAFGTNAKEKIFYWQLLGFVFPKHECCLHLKPNSVIKLVFKH